MLEETTFIYGLVDPITGELKYIGKSNSPQDRLADHIRETLKTPKCEWIKSLVQQGARPGLVIIEEVLREKWGDAEKFWISLFRSIGTKLLNLDDGGAGPKERTQAFRDCMRRHSTGRVVSDETRAKLSASNMGKKRSAETRANCSRNNAMKNPEVAKKNADARRGRGHKASDETRRKISEVQRGRKASPETLEKMSRVHTGVLHSEKARENCRIAAYKRWHDPINGRFAKMKKDNQNEV